MIKLRTTFRLAALPLSLLVLFVLFVSIYNLLDLPPSEALIELARDYYSRYGFVVVFIGAIAEGLLVVNWYLPGSFVIVLGVTFVAGKPLHALAMVALVVLGFFLTSLVNYAIGRHAWYHFLLFLGLRKPLEKVKQQVEQYGLPIIYSTYFHPNVGALTALSCGILRLPMRRFAAHVAIALVGWNSLWGVVVYFVGPPLLSLLNIWIIFPVLVVWLVIAITRPLWKSKRGKTETMREKRGKNR